MSAEQVASSAVDFLNQNTPDFLCLNFANPDMVGHTGVQKAIIKACETVDNCLERLVNCLIELDYSIIIIADHGNADKMKNKDGSAHTAHTVNMVPVIVLDQNIKVVENGKLADIAPSILKLMDIDKPKEMTGVSLI
jgi:2,3-bisphosphoglycerate-independent phosphoglycerate mutase